MICCKYNAGAHVGFSGRICDTIWTAVNQGMTTLQFFLGNPYGYDRSKVSEEDLEECKKILNKWPTDIFSHYPYVANLAGSIKTLAWSGDEAQDKKTEHILRSLEYELGILSHFKGGVVIHPGNFSERAKGLRAISESINRINFIQGSKLLLENSAGQGNSLAVNFQEIKTIIEGVDEKKKENVRVCIDTCHIYAYGDYDLSQKTEIDRMFQDFDKTIGLSKFALLHLNDSQEPRKSRKDRHACLGEGCIWKSGFESLSHLLKTCEKYKIPIVLETCVTDMITLSKI
jgi:apurinic endonuclease APN1